ncbi:hypothetical protein B0T10DRAFT_608933 [Thelonectria olida]|uniref:Uncharacterized protein n=1 Tax=Thelonectria olida TaxID=1576542 RepID=A0A9P9AL36_9HYPO|nr:hypothetical protein B0T10DRAFT_608933 [Thelonectria olida]
MPRRQNPSNIAFVRAREAEYQAMWQACDRATRKDQYRASGVAMRMLILRDALGNLMERRRQQGKQMCGTDIDAMIERHLQREQAQSKQVNSPPALRPRAIIAPIDDPMANENIKMVYSSPVLMPATPILRPNASPAIKRDPETFPLNRPQEPMLEDAEHNATLLTELRTCQADRSMLARQVHALEKEVADMRGMVTVLWNYLHPGLMMMAPQTPESSAAMAEEQQLAMMGHGDI